MAKNSADDPSGSDSSGGGGSLHAPWRMEYIRSLQKPDASAASAAGDCFICQAAQAASAAERAQRLVLWTTEQSVVLINRFPYTNGHLLIAPRAHLADLELLSDAQALDLQLQTTRAVKLLKRAMSPQGFNIGINVGRVAGAGVPGHIHQHVVPRWGGDTNFMSVTAQTRLVPEELDVTFDKLQPHFEQIRKDLFA